MSDVVFPKTVHIDPPDDDIAGVSKAAGEAIYSMLKSGRRYFGSAGASLTHQVYNPDPNSDIKPSLAKIGLEGERSTSEILREWIKDKPNAVLVDSVHINEWARRIESDIPEVDAEEFEEDTVDPDLGLKDGKDTDHVLIIGDYVLLIDTKRWKSKRAYSVSDSGTVLRSNKPFPGGNIKMKNAIYLWNNYLHPDTFVTGFVFINTEDEDLEPPTDPDAKKTFVVRNRNWYTKPYRVVEKTRFIETLEKYIEKEIQGKNPEQMGRINSSVVSQIVASVIKPYDVRKRVFNSAALKSFS